MKKLIAFILVLGILPSGIYSQTGKVFDNLSLSSKILKSERKFAIYLPPDYESSQRSYPVLYLLHGAGDDQTGWVQFGEVLNIADKAIKEGTATPMIIVMPDAKTGQMGYFNSIKGDWNYEDFFFQEFMPYIEKTYRIKGEKRFRAVAGLSMGGWGTLIYAMRHPELFSSACPLSAYAGPQKAEDMKFWYKDLSGITEKQFEDYFARHYAVNMINSMQESKKKEIRWYIDCGDDDFLFEGNSLIHIAMRKNNIPHEFRIRDGGHTWTYWREALPVVLQFVSESFHQY